MLKTLTLPWPSRARTSPWNSWPRNWGSDVPRPPGCDKLAGPEDMYRIRVGDYRIVYQVCDEALMILVVKIGHRRDVYR